MINRGRQSYCYQTPVRSVDCSERRDTLSFEPANAVDAIADVEQACYCVEEFCDVVRYEVVLMNVSLRGRHVPVRSVYLFTKAAVDLESV